MMTEKEKLIDVIFIHITQRFVDIYREKGGNYQQISFRVKRRRGRLDKGMRKMTTENRRACGI